MSKRQIDKAFNFFIQNQLADELIEFSTMYPHFVNTYIDMLIKKLSLMNEITGLIMTEDND